MEGRSLAHACQRFAVLVDALPPPRVGNAGLRHQVAFVGAIGEDAGFKRGTILHEDFRHPCAGLIHPVLFPQAVPVKNGHAGFFRHVAENCLSHCGLEEPGGILRVARQPVVVAGAPEELQGVAADDFLLPEIGTRQPARHHAAQVIARFQQRHLEALTRRADGGDHPAGRPAVHHHVELLPRQR